jgi:hypothetical protein
MARKNLLHTGVPVYGVTITVLKKDFLNVTYSKKVQVIFQNCNTY